MEIRNPKFKVGDKVTTLSKVGEVLGTISGIKYYDLQEGTYIYKVKFERDGFTEELYLDELVLDSYTYKPKTVWDLKNDDTYYLIDTDGDVMNATWNDIDIDIDSKFRKIGNVFLTKEEAENDVERRKVETEMLRLGGRRNIKIDICDDNYYIMYDHKTRNLAYFNRNWMHSQGSIFFDTYVDVDKAVKAIGEDRIKKYIFGV